MQPWLTTAYQQHHRGFYALALSITRRPELAEDAVHDAITKLARLKSTPPGDAAAYAFAAVRNAALDAREQAARKGAAGENTGALAPAPLADRAGIDPSQHAERSEDRQRLQEALERLPLDAREVVVLRTWAGLSFQQISDTLSEPLGSVASRYYRALSDLRKLLETSPPEARHASA